MKRINQLLALLLALMMIIGCSCAVADGEPWKCPQCGEENTTKYCTKCGTKKPDEIVCHGCGMKYPFDTDVVFCGECGTKLQQEADTTSFFRYEGDGFDTPEDAALCYMAGLKNLDFEQMLSVFAWETQAKHFDYKAMIKRAKGTDPAYVPGMPVVDNLMLSANIELIRDYQIRNICRALEFYVNDELYNSITSALVFKEDGELEEYLQRCDNGRIEKLATMENIRFYTPDDVTGGRYSMEKQYQNFLKQVAQYGADEATTVVIVADIGNETYAFSPIVARYGEKWYIVSLYSPVSGIIGIDSNRQAFYNLTDEMKERLDYVQPCSAVTVLPESNEKTIHYEGEGFSNPYGAVYCYFEGLKNKNVQQMMQAFAWETQESRYSLKDYVDRMAAINMDSPIRMKLNNSFMSEMNLGSLRYNQARRIYSAIRQYILEDEEKAKDLMSGFRIELREDDEIDAFIQTFDNDKADKLTKLNNIQLIDPATVIERYNSESVQKRLEYMKRIYGADEIYETIAIADLEGETLAFNPILARYGDKWYIVSVEGNAFFILNIETSRMALMHVKESSVSLMSLLQQ